MPAAATPIHDEKKDRQDFHVFCSRLLRKD
jgi:hypothetical protein